MLRKGSLIRSACPTNYMRLRILECNADCYARDRSYAWLRRGHLWLRQFVAQMIIRSVQGARENSILIDGKHTDETYSHATVV